MITVLVVGLLCFFENSVTEETHINLFKNWDTFMFSTHLFAMSDKKYIYKNPYVLKKKRVE